MSRVFVEVGYGSLGWFSRRFQAVMVMSPSAYRRGGRGLDDLPRCQQMTVSRRGRIEVGSYERAGSISFGQATGACPM